ncbi:tRNA (guanine-N(7)-)-methyltransferase [Morella rubra]|uniref:tRNA (guanine(46)-N(7))-methyltransferase n=1 Tax=Morella rubra TaxID=262757 RepID=A0A6A1WEP0_9ROSI|nr:tRNA (guanine-N(7)-)-methyltransferase [Morella rubra]KAB1223689.1 tRNA (guanine-N(7)-)-methyltransferase [Morella rubra]
MLPKTSVHCYPAIFTASVIMVATACYCHQCPNPDFNKSDYRWRMLQRTLVEAIVDLLTFEGKVFLQSDIEAVAVRMKEQFLKYGKDKLSVLHDQANTKSTEVWLEENPFGVRSDWEQHVIDRGAPMYRLVLSKSTNIERSCWLLSS